MAIALSLNGIPWMDKSRKDKAGAKPSAHEARGSHASCGPACGAAPSSEHASGSACAQDSAQTPSMPLALVSSGAGAVVSAVRGSKETRRHLETLGFVEGAQVDVVCEMAGNLIVEVKGSQVALDRQIAMKVSVCA